MIREPAQQAVTMKHFPSFPNRTILTALAASDLDPQGVGPEAAALDLPINILLVDDEVKNLTALETVLEDPAYRLIRASSADEALLALMAEEFALLILDIQMPGMNGFELATMIKSRRKTACVPIIFLTAYYSEDQHVTEGYVSGAVDFLHKPINAVVLRCKVSVFADLHRKTRDNLIANQALVVEVAQRKRTQEELRLLNAELEDRVESRTRELGESESRFRALAEGMPHFVWETDEAGLTTYRNARWQIYSGRAEKHTNNWLDLVHPGDAARMEECWKSTLKSGEEADWYCDRQSSQLARMVDDLLDVERINRGRIELKTTPLILETVLRSAIHAVQPAVTQKGHSLIFESEAELMVQGDAARLKQVFVNLLNNAAKYTAEGGRIQVRACQENGTAVVFVTDNGVGIPAELLPHVFDLFTQSDTSLDRSQGGLGIGLTVVRTLIEMHGGKVDVETARDPPAPL